MGSSIGILKYFKESSTEKNDWNNVATCRICYQSDGVLIEPCSCKGTVAFIHNHCLEKWIKVKDDSLSCELCTDYFKINLNLQFKMKLKKWFGDELFLVDLFSIVFAFMFFLFCIMISYISKPFICFQRSEVWTSTAPTTNKDLAFTSIPFMDTFLIYLAHFVACSIIITFMLFWFVIAALFAVHYYYCSTFMDHL